MLSVTYLLNVWQASDSVMETGILETNEEPLTLVLSLIDQYTDACKCQITVLC